MVMEVDVPARSGDSVDTAGVEVDMLAIVPA